MTPREEWRLPTRLLGRRVLFFDRVDSTSTQAAALAGDPANEGVVIVADEQTAGRGRQGHTWQCPPGQGILLSTLVFPPPELQRPVLLTAWAAIAVCQAIQDAAGLEARIKWPNDVLIHGRKVCGILIEQGQATIAGIGLNVNQAADAFAELLHAASLALFAGRELDRPALIRSLISNLDEWYDRLRRGHVADLETAWGERLAAVGEMVTVEVAGGQRVGRLSRLTFDGVELELADGSVCDLVPEEVLHLTSCNCPREDA
jgi:BirA family transcriptional regulator, biotin operon repressor / biotin---[acetyl-CoA-carboxylase] ligase